MRVCVCARVRASMCYGAGVTRAACAATDSATHANAPRTDSASLAHTTRVEMRRDCRVRMRRPQQSNTAAAARQHNELNGRKRTREPTLALARQAATAAARCTQSPHLDRNLVRLELAPDEVERGRRVVAARVLGEGGAERVAATAAARHLRGEQVGLVLRARGGKRGKGRARQADHTNDTASQTQWQHSAAGQLALTRYAAPCAAAYSDGEGAFARASRSRRRGTRPCSPRVPERFGAERGEGAWRDVRAAAGCRCVERSASCTPQ